MNYRIALLITVFAIGLFVGFDLMQSETPTGAFAACSVENEPCICNATDCACGNITIDASYCGKLIS